jgi:hypothetical protein
MTSPDFIELSARCEATSRLVLALASELEDAGAISPAALDRRIAGMSPHGTPQLDRAGALLAELHQSLVRARSRRRAPGGSSGSRNGRRLRA